METPVVVTAVSTVNTAPLLVTLPWLLLTTTLYVPVSAR
jgi:hypothetical protein